VSVFSILSTIARFELPAHETDELSVNRRSEIGADEGAGHFYEQAVYQALTFFFFPIGVK
jgi:hypothetical protein